MRRKQNRCEGKTKVGKPCRAAATASALCYVHGNPIKASELGRKGGRSKREATPEALAILPSLDTIKSVHEMSKQLFAEVYAGKRQPKDISSLVRLLELIRDSIRFTDLEARLAIAEK